MRVVREEDHRRIGGGDGLKKGRRSIRLRKYNYSQPGAYFVTICALDRDCLFVDVVNGKVALNELGGLHNAVGTKSRIIF